MNSFTKQRPVGKYYLDLLSCLGENLEAIFAFLLPSDPTFNPSPSLIHSALKIKPPTDHCRPLVWASAAAHRPGYWAPTPRLSLRLSLRSAARSPCKTETSCAHRPLRWALSPRRPRWPRWPLRALCPGRSPRTLPRRPLYFVQGIPWDQAASQTKAVTRAPPVLRTLPPDAQPSCCAPPRRPRSADLPCRLLLFCFSLLPPAIRMCWRIAEDVETRAARRK